MFEYYTNLSYLSSLFISTLQIPTSMHPICLAAPYDRSSFLPFIKGPLSLIRTVTDFPLYVTNKRVPNGNVLCAAVNPCGLYLSPFAVFVPCLYHDAITVSACAVDIARKLITTIDNNRIVTPMFGVLGRTQTCNLLVRSQLRYSVTPREQLEG